MIDLADHGDTDREDNGCGILYGILRDSAYKLKKLAEEEKENHIKKGWWPVDEMNEDEPSKDKMNFEEWIRSKELRRGVLNY